MDTIDFKQLLEDCIAIAKKELGSAWKDAKPFAEHAFRQYAEDVAKLLQLRHQGDITEEAYQYYMQVQQLGLQNVLLAAKGVGILAAQNTINAIMGLVTKVASSALGLAL